jgi:small-conductance mechanosensitive channel
MAIAAHAGEPAPLVPARSAVGAHAARRRRARLVNIPALGLVVGGGIVQLVALVHAVWLSSASGHLGFTGLQEWAAPGYAQAFVRWIAWLLLAGTVAFGVAACLRWRGASVFRYLGALLGVAGAVMTVAAVLVIAYQTSDRSFHVARNYAVGVYLAVLGLLACALGAAGGTGRRG